MFVSYDDGSNWQSLKLNLPPVPITDLALRHGKLVAATQGRGFWVLDDLSIVRQSAQGFAVEGLHVFIPAAAALGRGGGKAGPFEAANPASGVTFYYYLGEKSGSTVSIKIHDSAGRVVRSYTGKEGDFERCKLGNMDPRSPFEIEYPAVKKGLNKWTWDLKREGISCVEDITLFAGYDGARVKPGDYSATITTGELSGTVSFRVENDPRSSATDAEIKFWSGRLDEVSGLLNEMLGELKNARRVRAQTTALMERYPDNAEIKVMGATAVKKLTAWDAELIQPLHQTYEDEDAWETMLIGQLRYLMDVIDGTGAPVTGGALLRLEDLKGQWAGLQAELQAIRSEYIDGINAWAEQQGVPHVE